MTINGEYGLKIRNIKAATLFGYNQGYRERYDFTDALFANSLFKDYMIEHGLRVYHEESTRDIIGLDFGFGARSYEEELAHLNKQFDGFEDDPNRTDEDKKRIRALFERVKAHKNDYVKLSKDELRELFYENGVSITYHTHKTRTRQAKTETIHYRMLYRNASKAKIGQVIFINEKLYKAAYDWLTMGLGHRMPLENAKIVEMSAYAPLTTSSIVGKMRIPVESILILKDQKSFLETVAKVVAAADYTKLCRVPDEERTQKSRENARKKGQYLADGSLKYRHYYKTVDMPMKKCVVYDAKVQVGNTLWDGMALIESDILPDWVNGMALLRNHFFKTCAFRTNLQQFFQDWCAEHGQDYETYTITDMFGVQHNLKDIQMITTDNAIKWLKFQGLMGKTPLEAYQYWCKRVNADGSLFGIVKTDHPSKLDDVQQMSYQMVNTLPCPKQDIFELAHTSVAFVEKLKRDDECFVTYLRKNANDINHYEMMADLYDYNPQIANSTWFRYEKRQIIRDYVNKLKTGKIVVNADNLTICGNPYALLLYSVGEDWENDPTLNYEPGVIQCYTTRFEHDKRLCGIRNPHNSPNNICYLHNIRSELMKKYFPFSGNILAVNCIHTDVQDRANGCDFDSDFFFVTSDPVMVRSAAIAYRDYPTIVNQLKESGVTYKNTMAEYARMDNKFAKSRIGIGESSNLAQLALTYYWTEPSRELYDNFIILSVLAQIIIDGCKREYEVDGIEEIKRIKQLPSMQRFLVETNEDGKTVKVKQDFPEFMAQIRKPKHTKNGKEISLEEYRQNRSKLKKRVDEQLDCPMNSLLAALKEIRCGSTQSAIPIEEFFIKYQGDLRPNPRQMKKLRLLITSYSEKVKAIVLSTDDKTQLYFAIHAVTEETVNSIRKMKLNNPATINRVIELALGLDNGKGPHSEERSAYASCSRKVLKILYKWDKEQFLSHFVPKNGVEKAV